MIRKLILACAVSLALLPSAATALKLGGISAQSALNEPFSGEIELLEVGPAELGGVRVLLASEGEFQKVGAPRLPLLTGLSFNPQMSPEGKTVIRVSSQDPIVEPYLDFLIEVTSPKGRLVREFTVLLDPPVTLDRPPPQVESPALAAPPQPAQVAPSQPRPPAMPAQAPASSNLKAFPQRHSVQSGDGVWRIARKMAPTAGASVAQAAMALYRNNQQAFIRGDINRLKVGQVLEIPTAEELLALDEGAADREFQAALRGEKVTSTPLTDVTVKQEPDDLLKIAGADQPITEQQEAPVSAPPEAGGSEPEGASGDALREARGPEPEVDALRQELLLVQEAGESARQETEELRDRIGELEAQLADIQRLLKLRNEQLAQLQSSQLDAIVPTETEEAATPSSEVSAPTGLDEAPAEKEDTAPPPPEQESSPETSLEVADMQGAPESEPELAAPEFWESIPQSMLVLGAAVPVLLLVLGWLILRRRKLLEETLTTGGPAQLEETPAAPESETVPGVAQSEQQSDSASTLPPTMSPYSEFGNLDEETEEEADIVSEADVYIAYGRYREAESLLDEEIARSPTRAELKYKLAEAYFGSKNLDAIERLMEEMQRTGGDRADPEQWQRLVSMARDLRVAGGDGKPASPLPEWMQAHDDQSAPSGGEQEQVLSLDVEPDVGLPLAEEPQRLTPVPPISLSQDRSSDGLDLDVEDLDVISGGIETPETPSIGGAASDLELQLEDLDSLRDMDLSHFSEQVARPRSTAEKPPALPAAGKDSLDISPGGKDSLASDVFSSQWQMDSGMWDEVATKIDLARAYIEMEDPEAARVILGEVAREGNEGQRAEANEILSRLS